MKKTDTNKQSGFTAVELLITLFIGAAFIMTGYQLSTVILKDGAVIRARAKAASIAKETVKKKAAGITVCNSTPVVNPSEAIPPDSGITINSITTTVSAAYTCQASNNVIKVQATVNYKVAGSTEEVSNAIFIYI